MTSAAMAAREQGGRAHDRQHDPYPASSATGPPKHAGGDVPQSVSDASSRMKSNICARLSGSRSNGRVGSDGSAVSGGAHGPEASRDELPLVDDRREDGPPMLEDGLADACE